MAKLRVFVSLSPAKVESLLVLAVLSVLVFPGCGTPVEGDKRTGEITPDPLRIYVEGVHFMRDGDRIWLNGANTPWNEWEEFGGSDKGARMDADWWDSHLGLLAASGINMTRVWLSCDGYAGVQIDEEGRVIGPTTAYWEDVDKLMEMARKHGVYIMAGLISFDHTKEGNPHYVAWRRLFESREKMDTFVEHYAVPLVRRYADNPFLFALDVCNEILWLSNTERPETGLIEWEKLQYLVARTAQRVHEEGDVLVCVSNYLKYTSPQYEGNKWSDAALRAVLDHPEAHVDFYKIHYYPWVYPHFGFHLNHTPEALGMGDKPAITGEISAMDVKREVLGEDGKKKEVFLMTLEEAYALSLENGWQGIQPWTSNGVDIHGDLSNMGPAAAAFADAHPELVQQPGRKTGEMEKHAEVIRIQSTDTEFEAGILAPVGGRLVFLGERGGNNLLKSDPSSWSSDEFVEAHPGAGFKEFNGHINWLSPQAEWWSQQDILPEKIGDNWPPDPYLVYGNFRVEEIAPTGMRLSGPGSPVSGVRLDKSYLFTGPRTLELTTTLTNVREEPVSWGLWSNTRMDPSAVFYVAIEGMSPGNARYDDPGGFRGLFPVAGSWFTFGDSLPQPGPEEEISNKVYLPTHVAWIGVFEKDWLLVKEMAAVEPGRHHPTHAPVEAYLRLSRDPARCLLELEFHGAYSEIAPGETLSLAETWTLYPAKGVASEEARLALLERIRQEGTFTR